MNGTSYPNDSRRTVRGENGHLRIRLPKSIRRSTGLTYYDEVKKNSKAHEKILAFEAAGHNEEIVFYREN